MRRLVVGLMAMLCAMSGWACQPRSKIRNLRYAAVQAQPTDALLLKSTHVGRQRQEPGENTPLIAIEARFIAGPLGDLRAQGLITDDDVQIVTPEHAQRLLSWTRLGPTSSVIDAPRLTTYSGQRALIVIGTNTGFVQDFQFRGGRSGRFQPEPIVSQYTVGRQMEVQATLDGSEIVFDRIAPQTTHLLGIRDCRATVATWSSEIPISWQEPYLLAGTAAPNEGVQVRVPHGQIVLLPLRYRTVHGPAANARAMASGGKVTETYRSMAPVSDQEPSPLNRQWVVMIKASVVEDSTDTKPARCSQ